jgi:hypothetical protein
MDGTRSLRPPVNGGSNDLEKFFERSFRARSASQSLISGRLASMDDDSISS